MIIVHNDNKLTDEIEKSPQVLNMGLLLSYICVILPSKYIFKPALSHYVQSICNRLNLEKDNCIRNKPKLVM